MRISTYEVSGGVSHSVSGLLGLRGIRAVPASLLVLVFPVVFAGCGYIYVVRTDTGDLGRRIHLDCGQVLVQLHGKGRHSFALLQSYSGTEDLRVHFEDLYIAVNGSAVDYTVRRGLKGGRVESGIGRLHGNSDLRAEFYVEDGVFEHDTIRIDLSGYLRCGENQTLLLRPMLFHFNRPPTVDMQLQK